MFIIRKPSSFQLTESEKSYSVRERLSRMAGIPVKKEVREVKPKLTLENLRPAKDYSSLIESRIKLARKSNIPLNLIDNFNWHIQMARRSRKLTLGQVAEVIGESEFILKMIEGGNLVDDASRIINKLEQYFKINLRKSSNDLESERIEKAKVSAPARVLSFNKESMNALTISDLKKMKDAKEKIFEEEKEKGRVMDAVWKGIGKKEEKKQEDSDLRGNDIELFDEE